MPRSTCVTRKRNKKAKATKLHWMKIKEFMPTIFSDLDAFNNPLEEESPSCTSTTSMLQDESSLLDESEYGNNFFKDPELKLKTYGRIVSRHEYGTISSDECDRIANYPLQYEYGGETPPVITGNRVVDLGYVLETTLAIQYKHCAVCTLGRIVIKSEFRVGLVSTVILACTQCDKSFSIHTERPTKPVSVINIGAVWGTLATGSTFSHLEESFSCMDIPVMTEKEFISTETSLGVSWKASLWKSMEEAGAEEKAFALSLGHLCSDGTPWITVYVDGSWSKRSYGTNYNSLSGMIGIVGRHTEKLLFIAVRNKLCCICARAETRNAEPTPHTCYKNWNHSAPSMESDMAVQGFAVSEEMHGVRYKQFIGDGDSSVFAQLKQKVPYGSEINKIECTNHALKNYGKHLYKFKKDTHINLKGRRFLTAAKIKQLQTRAKCSIYEHSKSAEKNVELLRLDLKNGLHHVYGDHSGCREGICNTVGDQSGSTISDLKSTSIYSHIHGALQLLVRKAHLLIENETNNRAERLMNVVARFNMGKRLNLVQRGSYERRVYLAGLRYNRKFAWHSSPYKTVTKRSPGQHFKKYIKRHTMNSETRARKRLFTTDDKENGLKKKRIVKEPNTDYGANAITPEVDVDTLHIQCESVIEGLQVNEEQRDNIQQSSVGQFGNTVYESERRLRLTASMFGRVIKRKPHTPCHSIVKSCLTHNKFFSPAVEYGICKEEVAINLFTKHTSIEVAKSGLWIDLNYCFLGASPDVLIGDDALLEVKCLYSASVLAASTIEEVISIKKSTICLELKNNAVNLKRQHSYYYQIQGQLNITGRSKCYFVVYVNDTIDLFIEEIERDTHLWNEAMLPTLIQFYKECIAPEIVRDNMSKGKNCKDPPYILESIHKYKEKQEKKRELLPKTINLFNISCMSKQLNISIEFINMGECVFDR